MTARKIKQGDLFWIKNETAEISELGNHPHPYVVLQDTILNYSRVTTVVICALSSNLNLASAPGNVLLETDEGNLPKQSIVVVSKVSSVKKTQLGNYIGALSQERIDQIMRGMSFLETSYFSDKSSLI